MLFVLGANGTGNSSLMFRFAQHTIQNDATMICAERKAELDAAIARSDWETILTQCPVRESSALADMSTALGFRKVEDYEKAVRHLMTVDGDALDFVRRLFGNLFDQLEF